ncbi:hypothetical protein [Janthinobacterium sp. B9-8]|uniref:hypothetical protein n=1 Tax=Janthinobacterium sp. B9-8 TaxID=1236179 RepID=UPI00061CE2AC|nr:hypothetical protein [Janthinobacterium sp. B9-8]AMC35108.1 hypothetical protein VN23_11050 [Janthinobacterium sp. B9-8]
MTTTTDQAKILAFTVYELRLLLAKHLGSNAVGEPSVRAAAHLAYALHNQALAVLENRQFNPTEAIEAIKIVDLMFGENFVQQFSELSNREI